MIEVMTEAHLDGVLEIERDIFTSPWNRQAFLYELNENEFSHNYVWIEEDKVVGFCGFWNIFDQAQITNIGIKKTHQRKKIASKLMELIINESIQAGCETISLEVRISNDAAIALYKKYGFEIINIRENYYEDNHEDAYFMMKAIGGLL